MKLCNVNHIVYGALGLGFVLVAAALFTLDLKGSDEGMFITDAGEGMGVTVGWNVTQTQFRVLYWAGPPSTYQAASDFNMDYICARPDRPNCNLTITTRRPARDNISREFDAVLFRAWFVPKQHLLPPRKPHQKWYLMIDEAPQMIPKVLKPPMIFNFNRTIGYKRDSDIPMLFGPSMARVFDPPLPTAQKIKGAPIVWVAHNCIGFNNRHKYVEALMKHVNIHSYGDCLHNQDWPKEEEESKNKGGKRMHINTRTQDGVAPLISSSLERLIRKYKFYLSFENQNCEDYVSEKFFRSLYSGLVPVVIGAPNVRDFQPTSHSVIVASEFKSIKDLGDYLNQLDANDTAYDEFLSYKRSGVLLPEFRRLGEWNDIGVNHRGYSRSMAQIMCDVCWDLQLNASVRSVVRPFADTCEKRNYAEDAARDEKEHPLNRSHPPKAIAALNRHRQRNTTGA